MLIAQEFIPKVQLILKAKNRTGKIVEKMAERIKPFLIKNIVE